MVSFSAWQILAAESSGIFGRSAFFKNECWDFFPRLAYNLFIGGGWMRGLAFALALLLVSCATAEKKNHCEEKASYARGVKDAESGAAFMPVCKGEAENAYREGFESKRKRRPAAFARKMPQAPGWVCEVEASTKVFTGVGASAEEATLSAQASCGTHFQSSSCTQTECTRSL